MGKVKFVGGPEDGKIKEIKTDREFIVFEYPIRESFKSFKETCAYPESSSVKRASYTLQRWICKVGKEDDEDDLNHGEMKLKLDHVTRTYYKVIEAWKARLYSMKIPTDVAGDYNVGAGCMVRDVVRNLSHVKGHDWNEFLLFLKQDDPEGLTEKYWSFRQYLIGVELVDPYKIKA